MYTYAFFVDGGASTHDFHAWVRERESVRAKASEIAGEAERARGQLRECTLQRGRDGVWCVGGYGFSYYGWWSIHVHFSVVMCDLVNSIHVHFSVVMCV